ncbi:RpiR family transcriptional regulator [Sulfobacillus acidophilus TPY]|nr:RpiR family transcriptional regulator [Sulfobacillus acidophilus TPY]
MGVTISGVLERLESNVDQLAESEARVARWILAHPQEVLSLSVRELARRAESSQAAVTRLCRSLQIGGYHTLKVLLAADLVRQETDTVYEYAEIQPETPFQAILKGFSQGVQTSLRATLEGLSEEQLARVSDWIRGARRIVVYGVGASAVVADDLSQKLLRLGYPVNRFTDFHLAAMAVALLEPGDLTVVVSFSGETSEVLELAELVRQRKVPLVAITQFRKRNPLIELAREAFFVTATEPTPRIGATTSILASLAVGDALALYLANRDATRAYRNLKSTEDAVRSHRPGS